MSTGFTRNEIAVLTRIRSRFLDATNVGGGYWKDDEELALYDDTFAQRIGWKWEAVLRELAARDWQPRSTRVLDFGCGSGVASRRVLGAFRGIREVAHTDVSSAAVHFATRRQREEFPSIPSVPFDKNHPLPPGTMLVVSHVLNELPPQAHRQLMQLAEQAEEILWVEAGTHTDSRSLIAVREALREKFSVVAPCPHAMPCGMLAAENAAHWCHFFTPFPSHAAQDARWSQLGRELNIDLRALPYSFLVMQKHPHVLAEASRFIGTPVEKKGHFELLTCSADGVKEVAAQKRDVPELFKALRKRAIAPSYDVTVESGKVVTAIPTQEPSSEPES